MSRKDVSSFPPATLGRSLGTRLQGSSDSLSHPLLSTSAQTTNGALSAPPTTQQTHARRTSDQIQDPLVNNTSPPKYVPYTPRHRAAPSGPATSTSVQSPPAVQVTAPHIAHGGATGRLQMQNLKAAAQGIGLGTGSVGWAILERFIEGELGKWTEAWNMVTTGKATLLLPLEQLSGTLDPSAAFINDHVVFTNGPSVMSAPLITFSGLRGTVDGDNLVFRSSVPTSSKLFTDLTNPSTRPSALLSAAPLPHTLTTDQSAPYPSYTLSNYTPLLPCPPRQFVSPVPPPLPARPGAKQPAPSSSLPAPVAAAARLNPFASLFGRPSTPSNVSPTSPPAPPPAPRPASPQPSISSVNSAESASKADHMTISVFVVDRTVKRKQIFKEIQRATKIQIKETLGSSGLGLPNWVVTRVVDFSALLNELYIDNRSKSDESGHSGDSSEAADTGSIRSLRLSSTIKDWAPDLSTPATTAESFQTFFSVLEDDVSAYWKAAGSPTSLIRRKQGSEDEKASQSRSGSLTDAPPSPEEQRSADKERRIREAMDAIERVVCSLFYDRLFAPEGSDDKSHDEALASRVAALHMLDLTLDHLGVEANETAIAGVDSIAQAVGRELQRLEDPLCRAPGDKGALLVNAHNVIVEGLGKLPPVSLKPEGDTEPRPDPEKTPMAPSFPPSATAIPQTTTTTPANPSAPDPPAAQLAVSAIASSVVETEPAPSTAPASINTDVPPVASVTVTTTATVTAEAISTSPVATSPVRDVLASLPSAKTSTPVSSDILLPILIYCVVKSNPTQLVSHVLYVQRYRHHSGAGGEEGFCLINIMAVAEFLENVDLAALGLAEADRVSVADLDPIPIPVDAATLAQPSLPETNLSARLRGRVEQQVGELAGSANKVLTGVVDSSFSALRGFLGGDNNMASNSGATVVMVTEEADPTTSPRQGFGLLRRASGFSIASVAASFPGGLGKDRRSRAGSIATTLATADEGGQQMVEVPSRAGSVKSGAGGNSEAVSESEEDEEESSNEVSESEDLDDAERRSDVRSIRSFGSMMSEAKDGRQRKSLSDRLANVSARLGVSGSPSREPPVRPPKTSSPPSRRTSLLLSPRDIPVLLPEEAPSLTPIPPPNRRFMECEADDLKLSEIPVLLKEYRRMVEALTTRGAFKEC